ncbi:MAG TPA: HEAT repeat domain-containing protein [Gemmatimonadaceae bacterium]|jgi:HEAT repeat protein|nr:HEAT repeat domain-containing protein [Gemmatimonadaceae bacterium]
MSYALTFARHFARLVQMLLIEGASGFDKQLATLRSLVTVSEQGPVKLVLHDMQLLSANAEVVPARFEGVDGLVAQLIGHSIIEIAFQQNASPADLMLAAKLLSVAASPGNGGEVALARVRALDAQTISLKVDMPVQPQAATALPNSKIGNAGSGFVRNSMTMFMPTTGQFEAVQAAGAEVGGGDGDELEAEDIVREQDPDAMFAAFSTSSTPKGSMVRMFEDLDKAKEATDVGGHLDTLVKLAADSSGKDRIDIVADVFYGLVKREGDIEDKMSKRQYALGIRRLCVPRVLKCIVELLPRRRENYEQYMAIFTRAEDDGVEALVEALISAPSITDRRVYYDSLLRLRTGVRTLVHMLGDPRWFVVRNAIELLGEMRVAEADVELEKMLEHRDDRVRTAAASALAKLGPGVAAKGLRGALRDAPEEVRERAAEAMALQRTGSVDSLVRALDKEDDNRVQMAMVTALGQLGTPHAVEKLMDIARTEKGLLGKRRATPMRVAAVHALGEVKTSSALAALQTLLRDKEKAVRGAASWVMMGRKRESGKFPTPADTAHIEEE